MAVEVTVGNSGNIIFVGNPDKRFIMAFRRLGMVPVEYALPPLNADNDIVQESDEVLVRRELGERAVFEIGKRASYVADPDDDCWLDTNDERIYRVTHWAPLSIFKVP